MTSYLLMNINDLGAMSMRNSSVSSGPVFTKGLSQGLGLKLRLFSQVSAQNLLRLLS